MDEVGAVKEKIKKKHKQDRKNEKSAEGVEEVHNIDTTKAAESDRMSEKECISKENMDHERDGEKEKRKKKKKKNKGGEDVEVGMKNGSREGELGEVSGDNDGAPIMVKAERKTKKKEKKKNEKLELHEAEEVKVDGSIGWPDGGSVSEKEVMEEKKKKKKKMKIDDIKNEEKDGEVIGAHSEDGIINATEIRKKRKKEKKKSKDDDTIESKDTYSKAKFDAVDESSEKQENVENHAHSVEEDVNAKTDHERKKKKHKKKEKNKDGQVTAEQEKADNETHKKKKKKKRISKDGSDDKRDTETENVNRGKKRKSSLAVSESDGTSPPKSNKKVRFSDQDEVFPVPPNPNTETVHDDDDEDGNLVIGKRFTREEDKLVKEAVLKYIAEYDLGEEGLKMIFNSSKHRKLKGCWREIASVIPYRPYKAIYYRARIIFMRSESRKWTQEEYDMVRKYQETHGNQWRALADELGKHTWHVKDTWRRIKLPNLKKGSWSQEEYQKLFNLVNTDLQLKVSEEKRSKHGMLRDNISWSAISDTLSSRTQATCCLKWYRQMTSPMVAEGVWADSDDYRLISELYSLDATCLEDVDWDGLIEHRSGEICRKRWGQMVKHIGHYGSQSFAEQVEVLAQRYCPDLLEVREAWDNKPRVP